MYTLFWEKGSGSIAIQALMEEMGVSYQRSYVDMDASEHRQAAYLKHNPCGMVPALQLPDSRTIGESAAIVLYLGEQCPEGRFVPRAADRERPDFLFWLLYMATSGYMTFARLGHPERYTEDQDATEPVRLAAYQDVTRFFDVIEDAIGGDPYFLAGGFGALDIYLTMLAGWHPDRDLLFERNPKVARLCAAVEERPAYRKTIAEHS